MDFDLPCRTSSRWCSPGGWFWNLSKWHLKINTKGRYKEKKIQLLYIFISTFLVEPHLDDVLEVLLVVGFNFCEICIWVPKENYDDWLRRRYLTFQPLEWKKKVIYDWASKNVIKDKLTGRVGMLIPIFTKIIKTFKIEVTGP